MVMRRASAICAFSLALVVAGCASSGVQVTEQQAQSFKVGKSTYTDVVTGLGDPTTTTVDSFGNRVATYSYTAVASRIQNYIPYIGPYISGSDTKTSSVQFTFNQTGLLTAMNSTQTNIGSGTNLAAIKPQAGPNPLMPEQSNPLMPRQ
jgi:hypothetical protein